MSAEGIELRSNAEHKRAAIDQWSADPCAADLASGGEPGSRDYFERLTKRRFDYAPWMPEALDYEGAADLDVLDAGCGQGIDLACFALAGARVTGVDLTPTHVELARAHLAAMEVAGKVVNGDVEELPFPDGSFDRVSSNGVLHHTPDMPAALAEIRRVLRPGGEARILVYNRHSLYYWLNKVVREGLLRGALLRGRSMADVLSGTVEYSTNGSRPLVRVYSRREMRRLMGAAGFVDVDTAVRHFRQGDAFPLSFLSRRLGIRFSPALLDRIGRLAGWYIVARGRALP